METFIFSANAILSIILLIALGYVLKQIGFLDDLFLKKANFGWYLQKSAYYRSRIGNDMSYCALFHTI